MEKLPIVYDSITGTLFLVKNVGRQTLLMAPNMELTTLDVEDKNWMNFDHFYPDHKGSYFNYICMTGEKVCSEDLIVPLMKLGYVHEKAEMEKVARQLRHWGVVSDMVPVSLEVNVKTNVYKDGSECIEIYGDGFRMIGCATTECAAESLAYALLYAADSDFFLSIVVSIRAFSEKDMKVSKEVYEKVCEFVQHDGTIKIVGCV